MTLSHHRYFIVHKPYDMLSQFVGSADAPMLGDLDFPFPEGTHAIGRLDKHSEGLLILTSNKKVTRLLFQGEEAHGRTYLVRVKNVMSAETLQRLKTGVSIHVKGDVDYVTSPCEARIIERPPGLPRHEWEHREDIPHTWLEITLTEGKYRQIRKMVRILGHRCQRLIRVSIEDLQLGDLPSAGVREIEEELFFDKMKIRNWKTKR